MLLYLRSLDSDPYRLLVISEPSNAISTPPMLPLLIPYLPLPFKKREILRTFSQDLIRLCITSIWLILCSPALLDLVPWTSALTHCILPCSTAFFWLFFVLALILSVLLQSHSIFCYLYRTMYTDTLTLWHTLIQSLLSQYHPFTPLHYIIHWPGTD